MSTDGSISAREEVGETKYGKGKWRLRLPPSVNKKRELAYNNQVLALVLAMQFPID